MRMPALPQPLSQLWNCLLAFALVVTAAGFLTYRARVEKRLQKLKLQQANGVQAIENTGPSAIKHILGQVELPELEQVHWLNSLVDQTWPHINRVVSPILQQKMEELIRNNSPAWLSAAHLKQFDLGYNPPKVHGIRVYTVAAPDGEKLTVELEVEWHSLADIALSASFAADRYLMKPVGMAVNLLTSLLPLTVGVKSVTLSGRFCIMTGPLLNQMPIVTFAKAGLVEKPFLLIELVLFGASCTFLLAPLQTWINTLIGNKLKNFIVSETENTPVAPDDFKQICRPCGLLLVSNLSATNVPKMDMFSESDPYIKLAVLDKGQSMMKATEFQKTTVKQDDPNPVWAEEFQLPVYRPDQELIVQMWDSDLVSPDDEIGQATLAIVDLMSGTSTEVAAEIQFVQGNMADRSCADYSTAEGVSSPIKKRIGKPCMISCKVTYHAFGQHGEPSQSTTESCLSSTTTSSTVSPLPGLSRTVSQPSGPQGPELQLVHDDILNTGGTRGTPFGSCERQRRVFSEDGGTDVRRSSSWACSVPWVRRSSSIGRKKSWGKTSRSAEGSDHCSKTSLEIEQAIHEAAKSLEATSAQPEQRRSLRSTVSEVATSERPTPVVSPPACERELGRFLSTRSSTGKDSSELETLGSGGFAASKQAVFQGGMLYIKVRGVSLLTDASRGKCHVRDKALPLRMSAKVTVADQVKVVIVSTDRNAREDQILVFVVSHKDDVGMVELEVCDLLLGDLQGRVKIPFQGILQRKRIKGDFPVKGGAGSQLKLSVSLAWEGSH